MDALTKNAISETVRDRAKRTKIWHLKGYKSQNFIMANLNKNVYLGNRENLRS